MNQKEGSTWDAKEENFNCAEPELVAEVLAPDLDMKASTDVCIEKVGAVDLGVVIVDC